MKAKRGRTTDRQPEAAAAPVAAEAGSGPVLMDRRSFIRAASGAVVGLSAGAGVISFVRYADEAAASNGGANDATAKHQWAMAIDLRACDGCGVCTTACQQAHDLSKEQTWIKVYELRDAAGATYYMPRPCMHCENAPCLRVCPVGATFSNAEGVILVDQSRCIGCRLCMAACPYEARYFNWSAPAEVPRMPTQPIPEFPVPQQQGTVGKCILCVHNIDHGKLPACVANCPMHAIYIGDLVEDVATNGRETVTFSRFLRDNDAVRFKEELNTRPRVYYILGHGQNLSA